MTAASSFERSTSMSHLVAFVFSLFLAVPGARAETPPTPGVLLLAHGGSAAWNERVTALAAKVNEQVAVELAFGMATRANIQSAIDRLVARGATEIVAVPLFVSSHSSVVTSTEFLLGLRRDMPPDLKAFAKMNHAGHGGGHAATHDSPQASSDSPASPAPDPTSPVVSPVSIRMTPALGRHPIVAEILKTRAQAISTAPEKEAVVLVAHGPVAEAENRLWLDDLGATAARLRAAVPFAAIDYLTVRDDAPASIRDAATAELRARVETRVAEGHRVLIVPVLMSFGGIEQGIRKRLEGLAYTMSQQGLTPDDRLVDWVLEMARSPSVVQRSAR
jgi:sirohydrochlorin ferrochelatase